MEKVTDVTGLIERIENVLENSNLSLNEEVALAYAAVDAAPASAAGWSTLSIVLFQRSHAWQSLIAVRFPSCYLQYSL